MSDTLYSDVQREVAIARVRALASNSIALKQGLYAEFRNWLNTQGVDVDAAETAGLARYKEIRDA